MKLAMAQMAVDVSAAENLRRTEEYIERADAELIFFPEIQLTPFFPQYRRDDLRRITGLDPDKLAVTRDGPEVSLIREACRKKRIFASPNLFMRENGQNYDMSLMIGADGEILGASSMVHIFQAERFYERDYYTPSPDGFFVYELPFGRVGVVICFDRHLPESIRCCAAKGARLVIIPTANTSAEPMELFEWELRVQAWQNNVFIAMCNRVGREGEMLFSGESLVVSPEGDTIYKADGAERLIECEINLSEADAARRRRPYIELVRPGSYGT